VDTVIKLLDKARAACAAPSDNVLAQKLGVSRQRVSAWRHGENYPDEVACAGIARLTGEPLARVLGIVGEARAVSREAKAVWRQLATAAILLMLMAPAMIERSTIRAGATSHNVYKRKGRRRHHRPARRINRPAIAA